MSLSSETMAYAAPGALTGLTYTFLLLVPLGPAWALVPGSGALRDRQFSYAPAPVNVHPLYDEIANIPEHV
jgi:hypothetical protein